MHRGLAIGILIIWAIILSLFTKEILDYSILHNFGLFDTLRMLSMDVHTKIIMYGIFSPILFILAYTIRPLLFFPASVMTITSVFLFGPYLGFFVSYIGEAASASLAFFVGKYFGDELGITKKILKTGIGVYFKGNSFLSVFVLRIVPLFPFDFVSYASGVFRLPFKKYFLATATGTIPGLIVFIFLGNSLVKGQYLPTAIATAISLILAGLWAKERYEITV
jgi:uncharacterized membrane protein YdjX (TVP38/TMEM64 family)